MDHRRDYRVPSFQGFPLPTNEDGYFNISNIDQYLQRTSNYSFFDDRSYDNGSKDPACVAIIHGSEDVVFSERVCVFISLAFVIVGLVGNFFSLLVFSSKEMRSVSSNVYLLLLSCSDSVYLVSVFLTKVLTMLRCLYFTTSLLDFHNRSVASCKLLQYLLDLCSDYSTCLIMAFTIERFVAVYMPIKFREVFTVRRARIVCAVIFVVIAIGISPYHIMYISPLENSCSIIIEHEQLFSHIYVGEMTIFRIIPVLIIAVLNVMIIVRLSLVTQEKRRRKGPKPLADVKKNRRSSRSRSKEDKNLQITIMLILVSTSYIMLFLPVLIHFIIAKLQRSDIISPNPDAMWMTQTYTGTLYIFGFGINFFLYTVSGKVFREQLVKILCDRGDSRGMQHKNGHNGHTCVTNCPEATTLV